MIRTRLILAFVAVLLASTVASAQSLNLAWDASTDSTVTGYVVKWGTHAQIYTSSVDVGNRTSWTITGLIPDQKYFFAVTSYAATGLASVPSNEVSNDGLIVLTSGQQGQQIDPRPSLFWQNEVTGQLQTWLLNGRTVVDTRPVSIAVSDAHWKVGGTGDLNGDGFSDIVWRHDTEGWLAYWFLQHNQVVGTGLLSINRSQDPNWQIKGVGDLDGDRYADIVWQHTDGTLAAWMMRGATTVGTRLLSMPKLENPQWQIAAVADTNGDGKADLIWQEPTGGWLAVWFMEGTNVVRTSYLSINQVSDPNWRIQAAGDIDGSRVPKIVWRHLTDGWVAAWTLNGHIVTGTYFLNPNKVDNLDWNLVGAR